MTEPRPVQSAQRGLLSRVLGDGKADFPTGKNPAAGVILERDVLLVAGTFASTGDPPADIPPQSAIGTARTPTGPPA